MATMLRHTNHGLELIDSDESSITSDEDNSDSSDDELPELAPLAVRGGRHSIPYNIEPYVDASYASTEHPVDGHVDATYPPNVGQYPSQVYADAFTR